MSDSVKIKALVQRIGAEIKTLRNGKADVDETGKLAAANIPEYLTPAAQSAAIAEQAVPPTRKVNGKALSVDVVLAAADVGAVGFTPGVSASGTGPGNGTDQYPALAAHLAAVAAAGGGRANQLPQGFIPVSQPVILPANTTLAGSGAAINTGTGAFSTYKGTTLVPTGNFTSPTVATDTGTIAPGPTLVTWVNGIITTVQLWTYTSNGTLPAGFKEGMHVTGSGGTGSAPSTVEILAVNGNTLTLGPGCTAGTTTLSCRWDAVLVIEPGTDTAGVRDLSVHVAGRSIARAAHLGGQWMRISHFAAFGGTLTPLDIAGQGARLLDIRTQRYSNTVTYAPIVGPFTMRVRGVDHSGTLLNPGSGTTAFGDGGPATVGGQFGQLNLGTATPGGPALLLTPTSGGYVHLSGVEANNSGGTIGASCLVQHGAVISGNAMGSAVIAELASAQAPSFDTPLIVEESTTRGSIRVDGATILYSSAHKYTSVVRFVNGSNPRTLIRDLQTTAGPGNTALAALWAPAGSVGTARDVWDGTTQLA